MRFFVNPEFKELDKKPFDEEAEDMYGSVEVPADD